MSTNIPRVLSVGQCGFDHGRIARFLRDAFGARAEPAETADEALEALRSGAFGLVLVNRLLDSDGTPGLDLIRRIKADPALAGTPTILVTNFPEVQEAAASLGALPGFGKDDLGKERSREALAAALARGQAEPV